MAGWQKVATLRPLFYSFVQAAFLQKKGRRSLSRSMDRLLMFIYICRKNLCDKSIITQAQIKKILGQTNNNLYTIEKHNFFRSLYPKSLSSLQCKRIIKNTSPGKKIIQSPKHVNNSILLLAFSYAIALNFFGYKCYKH